MSLKEETINKIIEVEGGYVDDPSDSGGETNFGITVAVARGYGYQQPMKDMPRELAFDIYSDIYWERMGLDYILNISRDITVELADTGVNMGTARAGMFLQEALNVFNRNESDYADIAEDGAIGPGTIGALRAFIDKRGEDGEKVMVRALNSLQGAFYIDLCQRRKKDEKFVYGWFLHRVS